MTERERDWFMKTESILNAARSDEDARIAAMPRVHKSQFQMHHSYQQLPCGMYVDITECGFFPSLGYVTCVINLLEDYNSPEWQERNRKASEEAGRRAGEAWNKKILDLVFGKESAK